MNKTKEKAIPDKEILNNVMTALNVRAEAFRKKLKYNTKNTIYAVLRGDNSLSRDFINRVVLNYPEVSYNYLTRGMGTPLIQGSRAITQKNILDIENQSNSLKDFLDIPTRLNAIEENQAKLNSKLDDIKDLLKVLTNTL